MSVVSNPPFPRAAYTGEPIFRLSVDQYHELIRSGKLQPDDPVELLEGILVFKMPKNTPHATATRLCRRAVEPILPPDYFYDSQEPVTLSDGEPEPDGIVVRGRIEDYASRHPQAIDVPLVVEVADSSLDRDRGIKLRSYARAGIPAYWLLNLIDRVLEVYTQPDSGNEPASYRARELLRPNQATTLVMDRRECGRIVVSSLLPPSE
jgi:Uma2 family endonuclease